jgi:hypothetical protein
MKRILMISLMIMILAGCTRPAPMPKYTTWTEKTCALECQRNHALCIGGGANEMMVWNCTKVLDQCYQMCREEDDFRKYDPGPPPVKGLAPADIFEDQ